MEGRRLLRVMSSIQEKGPQLWSVSNLRLDTRKSSTGICEALLGRSWLWVLVSPARPECNTCYMGSFQKFVCPELPSLYMDSPDWSHVTPVTLEDIL